MPTLRRDRPARQGYGCSTAHGGPVDVAPQASVASPGGQPKAEWTGPPWWLAEREFHPHHERKMTRESPVSRHCEVPGCAARVHGRGPCRVHYDRLRYEETTGRTPEAIEEGARESSIRAELELGCVPTWRSPHGTGSMFASEADLRAAWEEMGDEILKDYLTPPLIPGRRPDAWWRFVADRPEHSTPYPLDPPQGAERWGEAHGRALDDHNIEPVVWMAANRHLQHHELEQIREKALEASTRVGRRERRCRTRPSPRTAPSCDELSGWTGLWARNPATARRNHRTSAGVTASPCLPYKRRQGELR